MTLSRPPASFGRDGRAPGGGHSRAQRDQAVAAALAELRRADGYRRGLATQLAREYGGNERLWQRAVTEARALHGQDHDDTGLALQGQPHPGMRSALQG
ncbi:hypothetical protein [Streptomyces sp. 1222.5]|uniref:hypothetical protein n=1 Tax=Streptomyces sp. 1222.5 TaxID=1881026 RepID=UPI003EBE1183